MDVMMMLNEVKMSSNVEVQSLAASYGVHVSLVEIQALRPLLDEISLHWFFTGIPKDFIAKVEAILGPDKTEELLDMYRNAR